MLVNAGQNQRQAGKRRFELWVAIAAAGNEKSPQPPCRIIIAISSSTWQIRGSEALSAQLPWTNAQRSNGRQFAPDDLVAPAGIEVEPRSVQIGGARLVDPARHRTIKIGGVARPVFVMDMQVDLVLVGIEQRLDHFARQSLLARRAAAERTLSPGACDAPPSSFPPVASR